MRRVDAVSRIVRSANGQIVVSNPRDGWPTLGRLVCGPNSIKFALYVGIIGDSHRGRNETERRFQNPAKERPIQYSKDQVPLLVGLVEGEDETSDLLVGFDARRRLGKRTRYSMFAPVQLIEEGLANGWAVGRNATNEELVAFRAADLPRYLEFRYGKEENQTSTLPKMSNMTLTLDSLTDLLGLKSIGELGRSLATELAGTPTDVAEEVASLLTSLAVRERLLEQGDQLNWPLAVRAVAVLDDRLELMRVLWGEFSPSTPIPQSHEDFVRRIYEDQRFVGREAQADVETLVFEIATCCESELDQEDLEVFFTEGIPSLFLYESVRSHLEALSDQEVDDLEDEEELQDQDDDIEDQAQPVKANVDKHQVIQLFNLVSKGRLDI